MEIGYDAGEGSGSIEAIEMVDIRVEEEMKSE
jgi:hypothetical protein